MNKKLMFNMLLVLMSINISDKLKAEVYEIDAASFKKEIRPGGYCMGTSVNSQGVSIEANNYYLLKGGKPWFPVMGEIHYSRYPRHMWEDAILKMKAGGIDVVASYAFWIHHEEVEGEFDFSGQRDLRAFLQICKKYDMPVMLRIGPWCHGEVRNGGFPDWVLNMPSTRSNDPTYLKYAKRIYSQYYDQCKGLQYKDDGPIIGIQLENEYGGPVSHIAELKRIARQLGFDVPLYTVTGWNNVQIPEKEVLPVQAGYADAPWAGGTQQLEPDEQFLFMAGIPINTGVGTDVLPVLEVYGERTYDPSDYPWLTAELGLGICVNQRRRPVITHQDAVSLMIVKLAGGANCLGYYMYHGGTNPQGRLTTLHEPGHPTMSYDFQCAVGEYGEAYSKYNEMKLIHYWLQDFGQQLCRTVPAMPKKRPSSVSDVDTFRCMARTDGTSGYLFFNNYQRYVENKDLEPLQVSIKLKEDFVTIPNKPTTIPKDAAGIWPINLNMSDVVLRYSTTQLICRVPSDVGETYFFFAHDGIDAEYSFDPKTVRSVDNRNKTTVSIKKPGTNSIISVISASGKTIRICTLTKKQAMQMYRFTDLWGQQRVVMADADVLYDGNVLDIRSMGKASGDVCIYPAPKVVKINNKKLRSSQNGIFQRYNWSVPEKETAIELSKNTLPKQVNSPSQIASYDLAIPHDSLKGVYDVYLDLDWTGNILEVYQNDILIADWIYHGPHFRPSLRHWGQDVLGSKLEIKIAPITPETKCYIEPEHKPDFSKRSSIAEINSIKTIPQYRIVLSESNS